VRRWSTRPGRRSKPTDEETLLPRPKARPWALVAVLALSGILAITAGGVAIGADLTRTPTEDEITTAGRKELAVRWRALGAGEIFPARADTRAYSPIQRFPVPTVTALRVGIAPKAACAAGCDRRLAAILVEHGCRAALRATYVDGSRTMLTTLGVAVMPDAERAIAVETEFNASPGVRRGQGVRTVAFPGTIAAGFQDSLRQEFTWDANGTPYLFFSSSGWITDRATPVDPVPDETFAFARTALDQVQLRFADTTEPCKRPGVRC